MFVLINIRSTDRRKNIFPLGLAYIAACFEKYEKVKVFDLHYKNNMDELYSLMTMETVECSEENYLYERFRSRINWDSTEITEEEVRSDIEEAIQDMIDRGILSREQTALVNDREEIEDITDYIVYVKPRVDTFSVGELMNFVQEMATTSAHCSHCYTKFA